jgi:CRP/FNR family cyclic AMP-dependent transcriptional regulator
MSDILGYAAASAVLVSFLMRSMVPLRLVAILSNILFVSYGYLAHIHPVLLLHAALLPINIARLSALWAATNVAERRLT